MKRSHFTTQLFTEVYERLLIADNTRRRCFVRILENRKNFMHAQHEVLSICLHRKTVQTHLTSTHIKKLKEQKQNSSNISQKTA